MIHTYSRRSFLLTASALTIAACQREQQDAELPQSALQVSSKDRIGPAPDGLVFTNEDDEWTRIILDQFMEDPNNASLIPYVSNIEEGSTEAQKVAAARNADLAEPDPSKKTTYFKWQEDDALSFDYAHLVAMGDVVEQDPDWTPDDDYASSEFDRYTSMRPETFKVDGRVLRRLIDANYYAEGINSVHKDPFRDSRNENAEPPQDPEDWVIVALRGAEIVEGESGHNGFIKLREVYPNHRDFRSVFILWKPAETPDESDQLKALKGSTVPSELHMALSQSLSFDASMMPQGLHRRTLGETKLGTYMQTNTFLQQSPTPVIREINHNKDFFQVGESKWSPDLESRTVPSVGAHIHGAGWHGSKYRWQFSSAGCQTLPGWVTNGRVTPGSEYEELLTTLGIARAQNVPPPGSAFRTCKVHGKEPTNYNDDYCRTFPMVLTTGREVRLHAQGASLTAMRRIRIGSSCAENETDHPVRAAQTELGLSPRQVDGKFGALSMLALLRAQEDGTYDDPFADGVITPDFASKMQIELG